MVVYQALKSIEDSTRVVSFLQQEEYKSYRDWQDDEDEISEDEISEDERSKKAKDEGVATSESCLGELLQVNSICRSYENDEDQDPATCGFALRNVAWLNERPVSAAKELASAFPTVRISFVSCLDQSLIITAVWKRAWHRHVLHIGCDHCRASGLQKTPGKRAVEGLDECPIITMIAKVIECIS